MPQEFDRTIQSTLNAHTSQSQIWKKNGAKPSDNFFYSPKGKGSGTWAVNRQVALEWLRSHGLSEMRPSDKPEGR